MRGRPVTKKCRKDSHYYVDQLGIPAEDAEILLKMKKRAMLMDGGREVLGFRIPLGLSTVLTFCVPEVGDGIDGLISYVMVLRAGKVSGGLGKRNHALMTMNVGRDFAIGAIPFVGAVVDMFYRANTRNSNLLEKILVERAKKLHLDLEPGYDPSYHDTSPESPPSERLMSSEHRLRRHDRPREPVSRHVVPVQAERSKSRGNRGSPKMSSTQQHDTHHAYPDSSHVGRGGSRGNINHQGQRFIGTRDL